MRGYSSAVAAILVSLLLAGVPAVAQETTSSVAFDGVGLSFDEALGVSVDITTVPGQPTDIEQPSGPEPPHLAFTLYGSQSETTKVAKASLAPSVVRFYRTADMAGYDQASEELAMLNDLLDQRPDLSATTEVVSDGSEAVLPYLPVMPASQVIRARAQYIDTPVLAGVAYVTAFRQDASPFAVGDFWYTFQGLSTDGAWYVAADFVTEAGMFPDEVTAKEADRVADPERYLEYLAESQTSLEDASPDEFTPPLSSIDALVQSIRLEDVVAAGT